MRIVLILAAVFGLTACGKFNRVWTHWTGDLTYKCSRNGVEYVQSDSGLAVSMNAQGQIVTCR
jgi:hypothetical protein